MKEVKEVINGAFISGFKSKGGRPQKFTPDELEEKFCDYIDLCSEMNKPITLLGFCNFIGVYKDYISEKLKEGGFSETIKRIRTTCEAYIEESMLLERVNVTAAIMSLKANFGWKDRTELTWPNDTPVVPVFYIPNNNRENANEQNGN